MDMIPRNDYGERCQFDAYCKLVLYHEAIDYLREMQRRRDRELSFSDIPQMEMDKLCVVDHYPSDRFTFSSHGYDLHIENELVADSHRFVFFRFGKGQRFALREQGGNGKH